VVVDRVRELGLDIVDLDDAARRLAGQGPARRFVVLTFDDGYRNNLTHAYPVLKAAAAPFTVYVATGLIDGTAAPWWDVVGEIVARNPQVHVRVGGQVIDRQSSTCDQKFRAADALIAALIGVDEDEQRRCVAAAAADHGVDVDGMLRDVMMGWDEIRHLAGDPLVTLGAHTVGHYALKRLDAGRARYEIEASSARIEAMTGVRPLHFAYPYGSPDTAAAREFGFAAELGFRTAVTTRRGVLFPSYAQQLMALPRISVNGDYQSLRYLDLLLSGVPYAIERRLNWVRGRAAASASR
jgi:peptidoglycan/xylan/chitin deacetylase (PgdA/CDA1 family)